MLMGIPLVGCKVEAVSRASTKRERRREEEKAQKLPQKMCRFSKKVPYVESNSS